jgi:nucleotide-binding universal stress UspA family protein
VKTIVVGYDGSDESAHALDRAVEYAKAFGARLVVVAVGELSAYVPPYGADPIAGLPPAVEDPAVTLVDPEEIAEGVLGGARARVGDVPADFLTRVGSADEALIQVADERGAGLIVVGTREPGFLGRLLEGSVSQDVAKRAHCDVLVVHPRRKG